MQDKIPFQWNIRHDERIGQGSSQFFTFTIAQITLEKARTHLFYPPSYELNTRVDSLAVVGNQCRRNPTLNSMTSHVRHLVKITFLQNKTKKAKKKKNTTDLNNYG